MPSIRVMDISALVATSIAWGAIAGMLGVDLLLRRLVETRLLFVGLLIGTTSGLISAVTREFHLTYLTTQVVTGISLLLGIAGLVVVIFAAIRLATQRRTATAPATERPDKAKQAS